MTNVGHCCLSRTVNLKQKVLRLVRGSVPLTCAAFAADGMLARVKGTTFNHAEHLSGQDVTADLAYARLVADLYLSHGPIRGRVAEVGPGGSAAVALHLLGQGCDSVDLLDRFAFTHSEQGLARLYDQFPNRADLERVRFHVGEEAAAERFFGENKGYDAILSCAVLEHLYDPVGALGSMASALNPGGVLMHQVDFRDHGMFTTGDHHELTFLAVAPPLYRLMSESRGRPNRVLVDRYREALRDLGLEHEIYATHLVGVGELDRPMTYEAIPAELREKAEAEVRKIRGRLIAEFRDVADSDLAVAGMLLRAVKTQAPGAASAATSR